MFRKSRYLCRMKMLLKRRLWIAGVLIALLGLAAAARVAYVAYPLFPQSRAIFAWRQAWFAPPSFYTDRLTAMPGDLVPLFASGRGEANFRLFPVLEPQNTVWQQSEIPLQNRPVTDSAARTGCHWPQTVALTAPQTPGWYVLEMATNADTVRQSLFVVPPPDQRQARIAMLLCSNTWNAYNCWGGQSLYSCDSAHQVSFLRPQPLADPFLPRERFEYQQYHYQHAGMDLHLYRLLREAGYAVDVYETRELETGLSRLKNYQVLTLSTHSEYWTKNMLQHLSDFLQQGGSLVSLSGNTAAYVSTLRTSDQTLHVYKSVRNMWMTTDSLGQLRPFGTEASFFGFHTYAPYRVLTDTAWAWAGTGLKPGDLFGHRSECYDYTNFDAGLWKSIINLWQQGTYGAASGMEVDKLFAHSPANFVLLAQGQNPQVWNGLGARWPETGHTWDGRGGADMGYYRHPGGGLVFAAGSIACSGALPHDAALRRLVLNMVQEGLK